MKKTQKKIKKGFTLIELLAVIVILSIILIIAVPQIFKAIDDTKVSSYNSQIELIKREAEVYKVQYINEISNPNDVTVSVDTLVEKGLLKSIVNPVTKQPFETGMNIRIITDSNGTNYEIYEGPELVTGMIPVYYDEINFAWKKADKSNLNNVWYDYTNYKWANAVTVTSATRTTHNSAAVNTTIPMTDINTMFVWIPRFKYRIPSGTGAREIEVMFETKYTNKSNGDATTQYYTHPSFTFGSEELNGIWVGKFEMTGTIDSPTIKPDLQSIRSQEIKAMNEMIKTKIQGNNIYGFINDSDVHMMKNIEWGAVTYLYHSKYGKYGNSIFTGVNNELYKNNSSSYYTGRSMGSPGGTGPLTPTYEYITAGNYTYDGKCASIYAGITECASGTVNQVVTDKTLAYGASTTGTIYGIYDMSGGAWEYVMGLYKPTPNLPTQILDCSGYSSVYASPLSCPYGVPPYNSQFDMFNLEDKYYDKYLTTQSIKGDATNDVSGWYEDRSFFIKLDCPWFIRGGYANNGNIAGSFCFSFDVGDNYSTVSFRSVITP